MPNRENLLTLATFLESNPNVAKHFSMAHFNSDHVGPTRAKYRCGTSACAVGWGPAAGIKPKPGVETWSHYMQEAFGVRTSTPAYKWLFHGWWDDFDNTPTGAAKRILFFLDNSGVPEGFTYPAAGWVEFYS